MSGAEAASRMHQAFHDGDVEAIRHALGDPDGFPNVSIPPQLGSGTVLDLALLQSAPEFVRELLALGADPNAERIDDGFPPLVSVLHHEERADRCLELLRMLLDHGADPNVRGLFTATPLHFAVTRRDTAAIRLLLERGADPSLATTIDDYETPREQAVRLGFDEGSALLG